MTHKGMAVNLRHSFVESELQRCVRFKPVRSALLSTIEPITSGSLRTKVEAAALIARLTFHANAVGRVMPEDEARLLDWASGPIAEFLDAAHVEHPSDSYIEAAISLDPVAMFIAAATLEKSGRCTGAIEHFSAWRDRLECEFGIRHISPENLTHLELLSASARSIKTSPASAARVLEATRGSLADAALLAHSLLVETRWGTVAFESSEELRPLASTLRLLAWRSARQRDVRSLGLSLVALALTSSQCPHELLEWIERMTRSDGLLGAWELFRDSSPIVQLKSSVDAYFGLHAILAPEKPLAPTLSTDSRKVLHTNVPQAGEPLVVLSERDIEELTAVALRIVHWLGQNIHHFRLVPGVISKQEFADRVKQFVELLIVLDLLSHPQASGQGRFSFIAKQFVAEIEDHLDWEGLPEALRLYPSTCLAGLYLPLLEKLVGRTSVHHEEVAGLVRHPFSQLQERTPMRSLDYCYLLSLLGADCDQENHAWSKRTLLSGDCNPVLFSSDSLYDITHAVFYLTHFGQELALSADQTAWLRKYVPTLAASSVIEGDPDVAAELVLTAAYANLPFTSDLRLCLQLLAKCVRDDGSIEGPSRPGLDALDTFERSYHTCLVTLAAIDEVLRRWAKDADPIEQPVEGLEAAANGRRLLNALAGNFRVDETDSRNGRSQRWICSDANGNRHVLVEHSGVSEPELDMVRSSLIAHRHAAQAGLAPNIVGDILERTGSICHLRRFAAGKTLIELPERTLSATYSCIGIALSKLHRRVKVPSRAGVGIDPLLPLWRRAVEDSPEPSEYATWLILLEQNHQTTLLHGDPHAGNVVRTTDEEWMLIDFEYSGIGPAELDLGIALSYVNTTPVELQECASALIAAYDLPLVRRRHVVAATVIAPIYAAWIHAGRRLPPDPAYSVAREQSRQLRAALSSWDLDS